MIMNKAQRIVIVVGLLIAVAMVAYPPWTSSYKQKGQKVRYGTPQYRLLTSNPIEGFDQRWKINLQLLFLQLLGIGILTVAGYVLFGGRKRNQIKTTKIEEDGTE